ncbi:MAG TPA: plastocyanin/azurin family copper-binding protein [Solirubrobacteraceae bacterium]|jgi:plastocyanin
MRKLVALPVVAAIAITGVAAGPASSATSIKVGDNYFVRSHGVPKVTVSKGTTVKWRFKGDSVHNVVVKKGPKKFESKLMKSGTFKKKMKKKGTYLIYCSVHGQDDQSMKLVVK